MAEIEPKTREEKLWNGEDIKPLTREEMYIKHIFDKTQTIPDHPITRKEMLMEKAGEGGGGDITIKQLTATENGTYSEEGTAYSPVIVNVPDVPPVLDELTVTENGTYTPPSGTDGYDEVTVSVPLPPNAYLLKEIENVAIASFDDGADLPMPKLKVAIEPQQEGSGEPSPTNVRPIIGWDECKVSVVDMLGLEIMDSWLTSMGEAHSVDGDTLTINYITLKPFDNPYTLFNDDRTVTISVDSITGIATGVKIQLVDVNNTLVGQVTNSSKTFTGVGSKIRIDYGGGGQVIIKGLKIYSNGHTYTIDLDGTRYGGSLDVVSGVLTVDRAFLTNNYLVNTAGFESAGRGCFILTEITLKTLGADVIDSKLIASALKTDSQNNLYSQKYIGIAHWWNTRIGFSTGDSNITSTSAFKEWLALNGSDVCYELATPITVQLSPTAVKSLVGTNNIFANCGQITEVKYFKKA